MTIFSRIYQGVDGRWWICPSENGSHRGPFVSYFDAQEAKDRESRGLKSEIRQDLAGKWWYQSKAGKMMGPYSSPGDAILARSQSGE